MERVDVISLITRIAEAEGSTTLNGVTVTTLTGGKRRDPVRGRI